MNGWRQVSGIPIFFSSQKKRYLKIATIPDAGVSFVEISIPSKISGGLATGYIATQRISPVYIAKNKKPVGQNAQLIRSQYRSSLDYEFGTTQDAVNFAYDYMKNHSGVD